MNVNDIFPSRFLKAHDLGGKAFTLTIRAITLEDVGHGAEKESKLTLTFEKATKMMLLNRTNAMIIASMYGPETDAWKGKSVTVYSARVKAFGAWHDALRIKEEIPARNVGAAQMTDAMMEQPPLDDEEDLLDVDEGQEPAQAVENPFETNVDADLREQFESLGSLLYGEQWGTVSRRNVQRVTAGQTDNASNMTADQMQMLVDGMLKIKDKRMAETAVPA